MLDYSAEGLPSADAAIASEAAAQEPDPDERLIGTHVGPYKVEAIAGHGGMGAVYRASRDDAEFRQRVAIKLVRVAAESPDTLRRFRRERQILARLSHPNIFHGRRDEKGWILCRVFQTGGRGAHLPNQQVISNSSPF